LVLFIVRIGAILIGSFSGGALAGDPPDHYRVSFLSYITQAGVGLGLAKMVVVEFPDWGSAFATTIIAVIVLNQIVGPPLFKWVIGFVGEARPRHETPEFDGVRDAIVFGVEGLSVALARHLQSSGWQVKVACLEAELVEPTSHSDIEVHPIPGLTLESLEQLDAGHTEAIIALLSDEENYRICELAYRHFGTKNLVVRLNDRTNLGRFQELGVSIVDPTTAVVSLLDHFVRSPSAASLLLGMEKGQDTIEVEVRNPDLHGVALRDLRLPLDTLILAVRRDGHLILSHGYTRLEVGDWVTVIGSVESLENVMLRFETWSRRDNDAQA
jgi:Trk K+ transport system NAD-binding subunit